jgi:Family of unknown function (DUF5329)
VKRLLAIAWVALTGISLIAESGAAPPAPGVLREIDFLLDAIGSSGCEFYRNGTWHDAKSAQAHVGEKSAWLLKRDLIATTDDFIERAATKSSLSGEPYKIRCGASAEVPVDRWLRDQLARFRSINGQPGANLPGSNGPPTQDQRGADGRS